MPTTQPNRKTMPGRFNDLVAMMPPRAIHDDVEYRNVLDMLDMLLARPKLTKGQTEYMETWALLVEAYESEHYAIDADATPLESLRYLVEQTGMSASDLGRLLGNRSLGSAILTGQRELSKTHIRILADHFNVEPGLFV